MAAPIGNTNATKNRPWQDAIKRALARRAKDNTTDGGLNNLADKLLDACENGELAALKELGDRVEGRAAQLLIHTGDENNPVAVQEIHRAIISDTPNTDS